MLTLATQHLRNLLRPEHRQDNPSTTFIVGAVALLAAATGVAYYVRRGINDAAMKIITPSVGPGGQPIVPLTPTPVAPSDVPTVTLQVATSTALGPGEDPIVVWEDDDGSITVDTSNQNKIVIYTPTIPFDIVIINRVVDPNGDEYPNAELSPLQDVSISDAVELTGGVVGETSDLMFRVNGYSNTGLIKFRAFHKIYDAPSSSYGGSSYPIDIIVKKA